MVPYYFLPFHLISLFILSVLINLQLSFGSYDRHYNDCSRKFECEDIRNVSFPFWGENRPEHCGLPGFKLICQKKLVQVNIGSPSYRVLNVIAEDLTLHIALIDAENHNCPSPYHQISLQSNLFISFLPINKNLTLAYGCPIIHHEGVYPVHCDNNNIVDGNYFWVNSTTPAPDFSRCDKFVVLPILETLVQNLTTMRSTVDDVLKQGFQVTYDGNASFCNICEASSGRCGFNSSTLQPACFCYDGEQAQACPSRPPSVPLPPPTPPSVPLPPPTVRRRANLQKLGIGLGIGIACMIVAIMLFLARKRGYLSSKKMPWKRIPKDQRLMEIFLRNCGSMAPERYSYSDIKKVTNSFNEKIGQGGYGEVYKGVLCDGRPVAVKLLNKHKRSGEDFVNEVASISRTSHVNVVTLLGFCFEGSRKALVYEFMANGSLEKFIHEHNSLEEQSQLGWETLFGIATGVARGLEYLHRGCNTLILHFDIKPHNILLDHDFNPKISDFGLAKLYMRDESIGSTITVRGTFGYIAPEMINRGFGRVSHKSDVYSYGMMVLEVVGKRENLDVRDNQTSEVYFTQRVYRSIELDEDLEIGGVTSDIEREITRKMILVALWCIQTNPVDRPAMSRVVEMLEGNLELLSIPPKPYLCSPPISSRLRNNISLIDSQGSPSFLLHSDMKE